jgi:hypothetical protein
VTLFDDVDFDDKEQVKQFIEEIEEEKKIAEKELGIITTRL